MRRASASAVGRFLAGRCEREPVERADDRPNGLGGNLRIEGGGVELGVTEQRLDDADVDAILERLD